MKKTIIILLIFISILNINTFSFVNETEEEISYIWITKEIERASTNVINEPILNSKYVCALDRDSKQILYSKNENQKVPMASTTKIMTAIILIENLKKAKLEFNSEIEVCKSAGNIHGSRLGLKIGDKITINDLLYGLMLCSRK